jgi:hypothetical protein
MRVYIAADAALARGFRMIPPSVIADLKRAALPGLIIAMVVALLMFFIMRSPPQRDTAEQSGPAAGSGMRNIAASNQPSAAADRLSSVAVIIVNNGKELPLEIKVGDKSIKIPGPSSWPQSADKDSSGDEKNRFLAGIIDTADVLQANGFKPDEAFSFVVGGTALNAANTFRVLGNHQPDTARDGTGSYSEEYRTPPGEEGIWRTLKFKNILLSYGQVPSLADFLAPSRTGAAQDTALARAAAAGASPVDESGSVTTENNGPQTEMLASAHKNIEDLDNTDPAIRANAIRDLVLSGYQQDNDNAAPNMRALIEKTLEDKDPAVREAALGSLEGWNGSIPMQALSRIVLSDNVPELRMHALDLLADRFAEQALPTLQQAGNDPDMRVARKARQLAEQFSR